LALNGMQLFVGTLVAGWRHLVQKEYAGFNIAQRLP